MKVVCKRSVTRETSIKSNRTPHFISFLINEYYNITNDSTRSIYVEGVLFWHRKEGMIGLYFFDEYFYTNQELRKIKLNKFK